MNGHVVVVGSLNMDLSLYCSGLPQPGETLLADRTQRSPGGKGANQAVAAARAGGARTAMVGAVGDDADGRAMLAALAQDGVSTDGVRTLADTATGLALITVDAAGENTIVVAPGANATLTVDVAATKLIAQADVVLSPMENPQQVIAEAARARRDGATFVLNAAPAARLEPELLREIDLLVVNEGEACAVAVQADLDEAVTVLLRQVPAVLVTLGAAGSLLRRRDRPDIRVGSAEVDARDTTAAGDTYCGVLAARMATGQPIEQAMVLASAAASLTVERPGAQESIPTLAQAKARVGAVQTPTERAQHT